MGAFVYILRCADDSFYVGTTRDTLDQRLAQHDDGTFGGYTTSRRPVILVYSEHFERIEEAIASERRLKGWSHAKKQALIDGDMDALRTLARRQTEFTR
jgi:putative endonuclease